jgi:preprotein translocase SecE subunit
MARNEDRAKARRDKRAASENGQSADNGLPPAGEPSDAPVPGTPEGVAEVFHEFNEGVPVDGLVEQVTPFPGMVNAFGSTETEELAADEDAGIVLGGEVSPEKRRGGPRAIQFFRASWAELKRVRWPDRRQVAQGTAVTLGFVVIAGVFLGIADVVAKQLVDLILN